MLVLNAGQTSHLLKRIPQFELSYETISHKKVSSVYDVCIAVPTGKKSVDMVYVSSKNKCLLYYGVESRQKNYKSDS